MIRFFCSLLLFSFSLFAFAQEVERQIYFDADKPGRELLLLSNQSEAEKNIIQSLYTTGIYSGDASDLGVTRLSTSDWFGFSLNKATYITDKGATHILKSNLTDFFSFKPALQQISMSNSGRESLLRMLSFIKSFINDELFAVYPGNKVVEYDNTTIYAFMDASCPFCRKFHLTEREELTKKGVTFVYIPFSKNYANSKERELNKSVFCQRGESQKTALNGVFMSKKPTNFKIDEDCSELSGLLVDFFLKSGDLYGLAGSPMFLSDTGVVMYGTSSLLRFVEMSKNNN